MSAEVLPQTSSRLDARDPAPPVWVHALLGPTLLRHGWRAAGGIEVDVVRAAEHALVTVHVPRARALSAADLRQNTAEAYAQIGRALRGLAEFGAGYPVRFWNHIPGVLDDTGGGQNRYMAFNAGRFAAFTTWYGDVDAFDHRVATATGVGHVGDDLVIHCLSSRLPGIAITNPRQTPPHRYSRRYGPLPPCFARATLLASSRQLLVGGTASVVGEDSLHADDLDAQFHETMTNLAAISDAAGGVAASHEIALSRYRALRIYFPNIHDRSRLAALLIDAFPTLREIEWIHTDLCRPELLVEIEGLASADEQLPN